MAKSWRKLGAVIRREYLERLRSRWFVITTILVPFMMVGLIALPVYMSSKSRGTTDLSTAVVLDATGTDLGTRVADALFDSLHVAPAAARAHLRLVGAGTLADAESLATREVMSKRISGYLVLDSSLARSREARYEGRDATSNSLHELIARAVQHALIAERLEVRGVDAVQVDSITNVRASIEMQRLDEHGRGGSGEATAWVGFFLSFLLYVSIIFFGQNVLRGVMEEKQTRVAEVVVSSVPAETLLAGKVIGVGGAGLTQQIIWYAGAGFLMTQLGPFIAKLGDGSPRAAGAAGLSSMPSFSIWFVIALILFFVFGITFYCTLFAAAGAMVGTEQEAQQVAMPITMLAVLSFVFVQPITVNPTSTLAHVLTWLPFSAPIVTPLRLTMVPLPWYEVVGSLLSVLIGCIVVTWIAARIYRVGLLMYGKKPSLGELVRWIRYAQ